MRIGINEYYMNIAVQVSLRSTCIRRKVGAVIVKDNEILGSGYNGSPKGLPNCCDDPTRCYRTKHNIPSGQKLELCYAQHAEINAMFNALCSNRDLHDASIFVTTFPCSNCAKAIIQSGIKNIYYLDTYTNEFTLTMLEEANVRVIEMDSSIYQTPLTEGGNMRTDNELDYIDPLVREIYKYDVGTPEFIKNREKILKQYPDLIENEIVVYINNINELYKEDFIDKTYIKLTQDNKMILPAVDGLTNIVDLDEVLSYRWAFRSQVEYGGKMEVNNRTKRHCVVAGLIMDESEEHVYLLKSIKGRLKGKYTLVQGHMSNRGVEWNNAPLRHIANLNMIKELHEEVNFSNPETETPIVYNPRALIMLSDNKISEDHIGFLYTIKVPDGAELVSNEKDKHEVVKFKKQNILNEPNLDTWVKTFLMNLN
jgi:dCMP deaminase